MYPAHHPDRKSHAHPKWAFFINLLSLGAELIAAQRSHVRRNLAHMEAIANDANNRLSWVQPVEGTVGFVRYTAQLRSTEFGGFGGRLGATCAAT